MSLESLTVFHLFPKLPYELRHAIYAQIANASRIIPLHIKVDPNTMHHSIHTNRTYTLPPGIQPPRISIRLIGSQPILLSINRETRAFALKTYTPAFSEYNPYPPRRYDINGSSMQWKEMTVKHPQSNKPRAKKPIYVNFTTDVVFFTHLNYSHAVNSFFTALPDEVVGRIERIAFPQRASLSHAFGLHVNVPGSLDAARMALGRLEHLREVLIVHVDDWSPADREGEFCERGIGALREWEAEEVAALKCVFGEIGSWESGERGKECGRVVKIKVVDFVPWR